MRPRFGSLFNHPRIARIGGPVLVGVILIAVGGYSAGASIASFAGRIGSTMPKNPATRPSALFQPGSVAPFGVTPYAGGRFTWGSYLGEFPSGPETLGAYSTRGSGTGNLVETDPSAAARARGFPGIPAEAIDRSVRVPAFDAASNAPPVSAGGTATAASVRRTPVDNNADPSPVPVPPSLALFLSGLGVVAVFRLRR